jgi:hypothetical protein
LGPVLANIEKSIKEAHRESGVVKRKFRDEAPITPIGELSLMFANNNDEWGDMIEFGDAKRG